MLADKIRQGFFQGKANLSVVAGCATWRHRLCKPPLAPIRWVNLSWNPPTSCTICRPLTVGERVYSDAVVLISSIEPGNWWLRWSRSSAREAAHIPLAVTEQPHGNLLHWKFL